MRSPPVYICVSSSETAVTLRRIPLLGTINCAFRYQQEVPVLRCWQLLNWAVELSGATSVGDSEAIILI